MINVRPILFLAGLIALVGSAYGFRVNGPGARPGGSPRSYQPPKVHEWPGHYTCDQCRGTQASDNGCWNYDIVVARGEGEEARAEITVDGPDGRLDLLARAVSAPLTQMLDLQYTGSIKDLGREPGQEGESLFGKNEVLFSLQRREDDIVLRFHAFSSKVPEQTVITCTKIKSPK